MHILSVGKLTASTTLPGGLFQAGSVSLEAVDTGTEALGLTRHYNFDAVLLDLQLPDMAGSEAVRRLRAAEVDAPLIALTGTIEPQHRIAAFAEGADDVVTIPVDQEELLARIRAIVRRRHGFSRPTLNVGPLSICMETLRATVDGREMTLTRKEACILELLMLRRDTTVTKSAISEHLYGGSPDEPGAKIIDVFVCKLRKKLSIAGAPDLITTVRGYGYQIRDPGRSEQRFEVLQPG